MRKLIPVALLTLLGVTHQGDALAAAQRVLVTGTLGSTVEGDTQLLTDVNPWLGQRFTIDLRIDSTTSTYSQQPDRQIAGEFENIWEGPTIQYDIRIGNVAAFSGVESTFTSIRSLNDLTVPSGFPALPPFIQGGQTYDSLEIHTSNVGLGCMPGGGNAVCSGHPNDTYEGFGVEIFYHWDITQHDALVDDSLPLLNGGPDFSKGVGGEVYLGLWHVRPGQSGGSDVASIMGSIDSISVTTVPLPQTWALLLPALGMIGVLKRRKA